MTSRGPAAAAEPARPGRGAVLAGLMLAMGLAAMDATIVATAVPSIVRDLGGFALFPWVFSAYVLAQAVTIPLYGRLADLYGRKPVLLFGMAVFLAGSVLSGISWGMVALIAFRGLQGIGAGAVQPVVTTLAGDLYTLEERARVQGWLSSVWGVSAVVGPALGGLLAGYVSWRWIFYINVPIGALALLIVSTRLHEREVEHRSHRLDLPGAGLLVSGVGLVIFGLLQGGVRWAWGSGASVGVFAAALVLLTAFAWRERRAAEPTLPPWAFGRRVLVGANLGAGVVGLVTIGVTTYLPTFAQGVLGAGPVVAGFALAAMSIGWPTASALSGRLYLRVGFRDTGALGTVLCLGGGGAFVSLGAGAPVWAAAGCSLLTGLGLGLLSTSMVVGVQSIVGWERRGVVTGANMFTRQLGQAVGAAVFGAIANAVLVGQFRHAPADLAGQLPASVDAASRVLGAGTTQLSHAAAAYVRHGLYLASHDVFLGVAAVAAAGLVVLALTPRRFESLRL